MHSKSKTVKNSRKTIVKNQSPSKKMGKKPVVIIRECRDYDPKKIEEILLDGLRELNLTPNGRTLVKPNIVAAGRFFPHAFTRPEFMEGMLNALKTRASETGDQMTELAVGERSGITMPTRFTFRESGYNKMLRRFKGVKKYFFEETSQVEIPLYHKDRLRDSLFTPEPVARADFFVNCPKFKAHPWTTVTFSLKNYIGIQDDRHRLIDHDHRLNDKVADLQYIIQPQFIAIDGITAGEGRMLTPIPFDMGLIIMGNNQVAFDAVCSAIVGLNAKKIDHIRMAWERGFGPINLKDITITGDLSLQEAKKRAKGFKTGLIRVEDYFKGTNIQAYAGPPPKDSRKNPQNYCWGGCPGAMEEAIEILRVYDKQTDGKLPKMHIVFGDYNGKINAKDGEKIVFIGDCATYHGTINGKQVNVENIYIDRSKMDPHKAKSDDIYAKMVSVEASLFKERKNNVIRIAGCPVSVSEQVLTLVRLAGLKNPYFDPQLAVSFSSAYLSWRTKSAMQRILGTPYQIPGPVKRGNSRPVQNLPNSGDMNHLEHL